MCAASSPQVISLWPPPARWKILQTFSLEQQEQQQQERDHGGQPTAGPADSVWDRPGRKRKPPQHIYTAPTSWAPACSPMISPWWVLHSVNEKTTTKTQGSVCFLLFFPPPQLYLRATVSTLQLPASSVITSQYHLPKL